MLFNCYKVGTMTTIFQLPVKSFLYLYYMYHVVFYRLTIIHSYFINYFQSNNIIKNCAYYYCYIIYAHFDICRYWLIKIESVHTKMCIVKYVLIRYYCCILWLCEEMLGI